jgi:uncharacterized protein (TIGR02646 family)
MAPTLVAEGQGGKRAARNLTVRIADPTTELSFPPHWNEADVRGALYASQGKVCAYCGCYLPRNDRGDVDHFRPKNLRDDPSHGGYWWIAYEFENYLLGCLPCNSNHKQDRFPLRKRARRVTFEDRARLPREARLLLDPARDPIEQWLHVDWKSERCSIHPSTALPPTALAQVEYTLNFFRINKDPLLVRERVRIRDLVEKHINEGRIKRARLLAIRYRPHSLVARQILSDKGQSLPSAHEELHWLLTDLLVDLDHTLRILESDPSKTVEKRKKEVLWSFATLWHDSPGGMQTEVESFLVQKGVFDQVREYVHHLNLAGRA